MTLEVTSSWCFIYDGGDLDIDFRVIGTPRLIDWQSATKLNANDNDSFADIRLAA